MLIVRSLCGSASRAVERIFPLIMKDSACSPQRGHQQAFLYGAREERRRKSPNHLCRPPHRRNLARHCAQNSLNAREFLSVCTNLSAHVLPGFDGAEVCRDDLDFSVASLLEHRIEMLVDGRAEDCTAESFIIRGKIRSTAREADPHRATDD